MQRNEEAQKSACSPPCCANVLPVLFHCHHIDIVCIALIASPVSGIMLALETMDLHPACALEMFNGWMKRHLGFQRCLAQNDDVVSGQMLLMSLSLPVHNLGRFLVVVAGGTRQIGQGGVVGREWRLQLITFLLPKNFIFLSTSSPVAQCPAKSVHKP